MRFGIAGFEQPVCETIYHPPLLKKSVSQRELCKLAGVMPADGRSSAESMWGNTHHLKLSLG